MQLSGHSDQRQLRVYLAEVDQEQMADCAVDKLLKKRGDRSCCKGEQQSARVGNLASIVEGLGHICERSIGIAEHPQTRRAPKQNRRPHVLAKSRR
jgi:hypothetical protein